MSLAHAPVEMQGKKDLVMEAPLLPSDWRFYVCHRPLVLTIINGEVVRMFGVLNDVYKCCCDPDQPTLWSNPFRARDGGYPNSVPVQNHWV